MPHTLFELDTIKDLPLWAQVLMASRMTRRAVLWLPAGVPVSTCNILLPGCDGLDRCAEAGENLKGEKEAVRRAKDFQPVVVAASAARAMSCAADAALAAEAALDFSAAETACINSSARAIAHVSESAGLSPLQVRVFAAADLDLLRFSCKEFGVGRYDGLGKDVMGRLVPVYPPSASQAPAPEKDPTDGAR